MCDCVRQCVCQCVCQCVFQCERRTYTSDENEFDHSRAFVLWRMSQNSLSENTMLRILLRKSFKSAFSELRGEDIAALVMFYGSDSGDFFSVGTVCAEKMAP